MLRVYREPVGSLGWKGFASACWRWFGCYLGIALFQAVLFSLGLLFLVPLLLWAGIWPGWVVGALALSFVLLLLLGLHGLFRLGLLPLTAGAPVFLALLAQQAYILLRLAGGAARLVNFITLDNK